MDDELRLQLEESIEMVVYELTTPDNGSTNENFVENSETSTAGSETNAESTASISVPDSVIDPLNDLEGTLDPDLQAVCDVLGMANVSPQFRRHSNEERNAQTSRESTNVNVKSEPRDILPVVTSLPTPSSTTATVTSSNQVDRKRRESTPLDLLTMLSLDKKPSSLSILPLGTDKNMTEKVNENLRCSLLPNVTIKSVVAPGANSTRYFERNPSSNEDYVKNSRRPPTLIPVDDKMFAHSPDSVSSSVSLPYSGSSITSNAKTANSSNMAPACCSMLPSRPSDVINSNHMSYNRMPNVSRPSSCSYANCNIRRMSPYPPQQYQHFYAGMRSPGSRVAAPPYSAAGPRSVHPSLSTFGMNGSCCTSVTSPGVSPSMMMMNSKSNNYSALPSILPPMPLNTCRMPLSPVSPSYARSREYSNIFPDSTANVAGPHSETMTGQQQQQQQQPGFRAPSSWSGSLNALHNPATATSRSLGFLSPKGNRVPSMPAPVQHSPNLPYKNQLLANGSTPTSFHYPVSGQNSNVVGTGSGTNGYEDLSASSGIPFRRAQCCFSSQIQCFNSACENTAAQQHVSIIQHSTRLSNLKSNSMDSISSMLQYHSYFKKY